MYWYNTILNQAINMCVNTNNKTKTNNHSHLRKLKKNKRIYGFSGEKPKKKNETRTLGAIARLENVQNTLNTYGKPKKQMTHTAFRTHTGTILLQEYRKVGTANRDKVLHTGGLYSPTAGHMPFFSIIY